MTSSKTSRAPTRSHSARSPSRNPGAGGTRPMLAATGSTITQATPSSRVGHHVVGRHDGVGHRAGGHAGRAGDGAGLAAEVSISATALPGVGQQASLWPW